MPGYEGTDLLVSIFTSRSSAGPASGFFHTHGGMIIGDRFTGINIVLNWVGRFGGVCVSVEYRLAPEFGDPYPVEDCYAALACTAQHAGELGIDPGRLIIVGGPGGGLAAGTSLLSRDRKGPVPAGLVLMYPTLDDRNNTLMAPHAALSHAMTATRTPGSRGCSPGPAMRLSERLEAR